MVKMCEFDELSEKLLPLLGHGDLRAAEFHFVAKDRTWEYRLVVDGSVAIEAFRGLPWPAGSDEPDPAV